MVGQPYTLAFHLQERLSFEQRNQAFLLALDTVLDMTLPDAPTFEAVVEEVEEIPEPWARPSTWPATLETWDDGLSTAPLPLRLGCGCLGLLFKPLIWLGVAKKVPTYRVRGTLTPMLATYLRHAVRSHLVVSMRLEQNARLVWTFWDYGDHWEVDLPPEPLNALCTSLSELLGVSAPLEPMPPQ